MKKDVPISLRVRSSPSFIDLKYCKQKIPSQLIIKPKFEPRKTKYLINLAIQRKLQKWKVAKLLPLKSVQVHVSVRLTPS
jgi:hypothetical protein